MPVAVAGQHAPGLQAPDQQRTDPHLGLVGAGPGYDSRTVRIGSETRNVDDQAEWYDNSHILYALPDEGPPATIATHIWLTSIDTDEPPRIFLRYASSPSVVR